MSVKIDLQKVHSLLNSYIEREDIDCESRLLLKRFVQKLGESSSFASISNSSFFHLEKTEFEEKFKEALTGEVDICNIFKLKFSNKTKSWNMFLLVDNKEELFLDGLDWRLTRQILIDLNVAYLIKNKRNEKTFK